ncbi:hypothetical protein GHT07_20945, partial [Caenimonas koreensis DSM 17982]|nr:hypothetical protein [Caenimonas koreensis DSM 17982]
MTVPKNNQQDSHSMVAIVSGNSLGLSLTSLATLGQQGSVGSSGAGRSGEQVFVNASNGNLVLRDQDDFVAAYGLDVSAVRTYNSAGKIVGGVQDSWAVGVSRQKVTVPTTWGAVTITRTDFDGAEATYTWDAASSSYFTTAGAGANDTITRDAGTGQYIWTDGATGTVERYDANGRLVSTEDIQGNRIVHTYNAQGRLASSVGANGETVAYLYSAAGDLTDVTTSVVAGTVTKRVHYDWDTSHRMTRVTVDLTPADGSTADGVSYWTTYSYVGTSNRIETIAQKDNSSLKFGYDAQQRVVSITDALGRVTTLNYDATGLKTRVTTPANVTSDFLYNAAGRLSEIDVGGQLEHAFSYVNANVD